MLNPAIGKLIRHYDSRYQLVLDVAHKARQISERAEQEEEILLDKPVTLAMNYLTSELEDDE